MPPAIATPPRAPPKTTNYALVGTAFDYFFHFEIQRRHPEAIVEESVAEASLRLLPR